MLIYFLNNRDFSRFQCKEFRKIKKKFYIFKHYRFRKTVIYRNKGTTSYRERTNHIIDTYKRYLNDKYEWKCQIHMSNLTFKCQICTHLALKFEIHLSSVCNQPANIHTLKEYVPDRQRTLHKTWACTPIRSKKINVIQEVNVNDHSHAR